jgi:hypothetical protein
VVALPAPPRARRRPLFIDGEPWVVDEPFRRSRTTSAERPQVVPVMSHEEAQAALARTEAVGAFWNPVAWPMCCGALAVLLLANPTQEELAEAEARLGALDAACPIDHGWSGELEAIRAGAQPEDGVNVFQCSRCGRSYGVHSHT